MEAHPDGGEFACSLTDDELHERRAIARRSLLPHLVEFRNFGSKLELTFPDTDTLRQRTETFVSFERQCCSFLTFTISPTGEGLMVTIEGPPEARATLELFAAAIANAR